MAVTRTGKDDDKEFGRPSPRIWATATLPIFKKQAGNVGVTSPAITACTKERNDSVLHEKFKTPHFNHPHMKISDLLACLRSHILAGTFLLGLLHAGTPTFADESRKIAPVLQPFVESQTLAGAVTLVASPEKILSLEAVGWADVAAKKPLRTDAVFWIASQSKPITAAALMVLVDEGRVNVDDPVEKYLPEFKGQMVAPQKGETEPVEPRSAPSETASCFQK